MSDQYWNEIETQMKLRKETALSKIVASKTMCDVLHGKEIDCSIYYYTTGAE